MTTSTPAAFVDVWADTVTRGRYARCRERRCRATIWFAKTIGRGRMMPFNPPQVPASTMLEPGGTGRLIWRVPETQIHFVTCRARKPAGHNRTSAAPTERRHWQDRDE